MIVIRTNYQYDVLEVAKGRYDVICRVGMANETDTVGRGFKSEDEAIEFIDEFDESCN